MKKNKAVTLVSTKNPLERQFAATLRPAEETHARSNTRMPLAFFYFYLSLKRDKRDKSDNADGMAGFFVSPFV